MGMIGGTGRIVALGIIIIIAVAVVADYAINNSKSINQPAMPSLTSAVPPEFSAISSAVNSSGTRNATETLAAMVQGFGRNSSNVSVHYNGIFYGHLSGFGSVISLDTPLYINYTRSGGNFSFSFNASGLPLIGPIFLKLVNSSSGAEVCSNVNLTALEGMNILGMKSKTFSCRQASKYGFSVQQLQHFNYSDLAGYGLTVNYTSVHQSTYDGQNCTYISGNVGQPSKSGAGKFSMCISDYTLMPLTVYASFKNTQGSMYLLLNETN